jgi:hypothetical protein
MVGITRRVVRKVTTHKGTKLVVSLTPEGLWVREYRRRQGYLLPFGHALVAAARLHADSMRAEKKRAKKGKAK